MIKGGGPEERRVWYWVGAQVLRQVGPARVDRGGRERERPGVSPEGAQDCLGGGARPRPAGLLCTGLARVEPSPRSHSAGCELPGPWPQGPVCTTGGVGWVGEVVWGLPGAKSRSVRGGQLRLWSGVGSREVAICTLPDLVKAPDFSRNAARRDTPPSVPRRVGRLRSSSEFPSRCRCRVYLGQARRMW